MPTGIGSKGNPKKLSTRAEEELSGMLRKTGMKEKESRRSPSGNRQPRRAPSAAEASAARSSAEGGAAAAGADEEEMEDGEDEGEAELVADGLQKGAVQTAPEVTRQEFQELTRRFEMHQEETEVIRHTVSGTSHQVHKLAIDMVRRTLMCFTAGQNGLNATRRIEEIKKLARAEGIEVSTIGFETYGRGDSAPVEARFMEGPQAKRVLKASNNVQGLRMAPKLAEDIRTLDGLVGRWAKAREQRTLVRSWTGGSPATWVLVRPQEGRKSKAVLTLQIKGDVLFASGEAKEAFGQEYEEAQEEERSVLELPWRLVRAQRDPKLSETQQAVVEKAGQRRPE